MRYVLCMLILGIAVGMTAPAALACGNKAADCPGRPGATGPGTVVALLGPVSPAQTTIVAGPPMHHLWINDFRDQNWGR
jgi:hypothetical protein